MSDIQQQFELDLLEKRRAAAQGTASHGQPAVPAAPSPVAQATSLFERYDLFTDPEGARYRLRTDGMTPIRPGANEWEYIPEEVASRWEAALRNSEDPENMEYRLRGAWFLSRLTGSSFEDAYNDQDGMMRQWRSEALQPRTWAEAVEGTWKAAWLSNEIAKRAYQLWNKGYTGQDVQKDPLYQEILALEAQMPAPDQMKRWLPTKALKALAQFVPSFVESMGAGAIGGAAGAAGAGAMAAASGLAGATSLGVTAIGAATVGLGGFVLPAIVAAGFGLGAAAGAGLKSRELETGSTYYDLLRYQDPNTGARINPQAALLWSGVYGGLAAAVESLQMDTFFEAFPGLGKAARKAVTKAVEDSLEDKTAAAARSGILQRALGRFVTAQSSKLGHRAADIAGETAQAVIQEALNIGAEAIARDATERMDGTSLTPMQKDEIFGRLKDTLVQSALGFSAMHALPATISLFVDAGEEGAKAKRAARVYANEEVASGPVEVKPEDMEVFRKRAEEPAPEGLHLQPDEIIEGEQYVMKAGVGKDRVGSVRYEIEDSEEGTGTVRILGLEKGTAPNVGAALLRSVAYRFPGWNIEWDPKSPSQAALKQYLIETNPRGATAGLQGFAAPREMPGQVSMAYLKERIRDVAPGWNDDEVDVGARIFGAWARKLGMGADELANAALAPEVFGQVMSRAAVAQGATGATAQIRVGDSFKAIMQMAPTANPSTIIHEATHAVVLFARQAAETDQRAKAFLLELESAMGVQDGNWDGEFAGWTEEYKGGNRSYMEALTYALEDYFNTGKAPKPELEPLFKKVARWVLDIYKAMKGARVQMSPEMTAYFDDLIGGEGSPFLEDSSRQTENELKADQAEAAAAPKMAKAMGERSPVMPDDYQLFQRGPAEELRGAQGDLERAKAMAEAGQAPEEIEAQTGWRQGPDGDWSRDRGRAPTPAILSPEAQGAIGEAADESSQAETSWGAVLGREKAFAGVSHEALERIQRNPLYQGATDTESPEFKAWFEGSKVVDKQGAPVVMYHGRPRGWEESGFTPNDSKGVYFTSDPGYASNYAVEFRAKDRHPEFSDIDLTGSVFPVYLSIKNPLEIDAADESAVEKYQNYGYSPKELKEQGYDGVLLRWPDGEVEATAFSKLQIKSKFDPLYQGDKNALFARDEALDAVMTELEGRAMPYDVMMSRKSLSLYVQFEHKGEKYSIRLSDHPTPRQAVTLHGAPDFEIDYRNQLDTEALRKFLDAPEHRKVYYQGGAHSLDLADLADEAVYFQLSDLSHGSAAGFDRFDHSFMGSGEGQQVYGWGTYLTENRNVAKKQYAERVGERVQFMVARKDDDGLRRIFDPDSASPAVRSIADRMKQKITAAGPGFPTKGAEAGEALHRVFEEAYKERLAEDEYHDALEGGDDAKRLKSWHDEFIEQSFDWREAEIKGGHWLYSVNVDEHGKAPSVAMKPAGAGWASPIRKSDIKKLRAEYKKWDGWTKEDFERELGAGDVWDFWIDEGMDEEKAGTFMGGFIEELADDGIDDLGYDDTGEGLYDYLREKMMNGNERAAKKMLERAGITDIYPSTEGDVKPILLGRASLESGEATIQGVHGKLSDSNIPKWSRDTFFKYKLSKYKKYAFDDAMSDDQAAGARQAAAATKAIKEALDQSIKENEGYPDQKNLIAMRDFLFGADGSGTIRIVPTEDATNKVMLTTDMLDRGECDLGCHIGDYSASDIAEFWNDNFASVSTHDPDGMAEVEEGDVQDVLDGIKAALSANTSIPAVPRKAIDDWLNIGGIFDIGTMPSEVKAHSDALTKVVNEALKNMANQEAVTAVSTYFAGPDDQPALFLIPNNQTPEDESADAKDGRWIRWDKPVRKADIESLDSFAKELIDSDGETLLKIFGDDPEIIEGIDEKLEMIASVSSHLEEIEEIEGHPATGEEFYRAIERALESPKAASLFLYAAGFDGTKYPVSFLTGGKGDSGFNYVVFNEGAINITKRVLFQGEFGKEWPCPENQPQRAIDTILSTQEGVVEHAVYRDGVGWIAIPWGSFNETTKAGLGLAKIVGKHEEENEGVIKALADVLAHGAVYTDPQPGHEDKLLIMGAGYRVVISMVRRFGGKEAYEPWLFNAFLDRKNAASGKDEPPAGAKTVSPSAPRAEGGDLPSGPGAQGQGVAKRRVVVKRRGPDGKLYQAEAWHGSASNFDSFDAEHVGEGEGAQAFGWGLYFTDNEQIARWYAHKLTNGGPYVLINGDLYEKTNEGWQGPDGNLSEIKDWLAAEAISYGGTTKEAIAAIDRSLSGEASLPYLRDATQEDLAAAKKALETGAFEWTGGRNLYKVAINKGKDDVWLDWDESMAAQSPEAKKVITAMGYYIPEQDELEKAYEQAENELVEEAIDEDVIPGIPEVDVRYNEDDETWDIYFNGEYEDWAKTEEEAWSKGDEKAEKAQEKAVHEMQIDAMRDIPMAEIEKRQREVLLRGKPRNAEIVIPTTTGAEFYRQMCVDAGWTNDPWTRAENAPRDVSLDLLGAGFTGIRYPAASMGVGGHDKGTNYVVFDDSLLEIEEHILYQNGGGMRTGIAKSRAAMYQGGDGDEPGVDAIKEIARDSAERGEGWEEFMAFCEAMYTDAERERWNLPKDLTPDAKRAWYKKLFEEAQTPPDQDEALTAWLESLQKDDHAGLMTALKAIWTEVLLSEKLDLPAGADEDEAREWSEKKARASELKQQIAEPIIAAAARIGGKGRSYLAPQMRGSIMGIIRRNPEEYAAIIGEITGDKKVQALGAKAVTEKYADIKSPKLGKGLSISKRAALASEIRDEKLAKAIRSGEVVVGDEVKGLIERSKKAEKEAQDRIKKLEGELRESEADLDEQGRALVGARGKYQETRQELKKTMERLRRFSERGEPYPSILESRRAKLEGDRERIRAKLTAAGDWLVIEEDLAKAKKDEARAERAIERARADGKRPSTKAIERRSEARSQIRALEAKLAAADEYKSSAELQTYLVKAEALAKERNRVTKAAAERKALKTIQAYRNQLEKYIMAQIPATVRVDEARQIHQIQKALSPDHPNARTKEMIDLLKSELATNPALAREVPKRWLDRLGRPVSEMSLAELEDTANRIKDLRDQGRAALAQIKRDRSDESMEAQIRIAEAVMAVKGYREPSGYETEKTLLDKMKGKLREFDYAFLNMRRFANWMDGGKEDGHNVELLWHEMNRHYRDEMEARARRTKRILDAFKEAGVSPDDWYDTRVEVVGAGPGRITKTLRKSDLMALELAFRNEDSRQAAIFGKFFSEKERKSMDEEELLFEGAGRFDALRAAIDKVLTEKDQKVLEAFSQDAAETAPRLSEVVARAENREMIEVEDYFPIIHELVSGVPLDVQVSGDVLDRTAGTRRPPRNGFTKQRVAISPKNQSPIKLDLLSTWLDSIGRQEHYIATVEYGKRLDSFYLAPYVQEQIRGAFGQEGVDYVKEYIAEVKNPGELRNVSRWENSIRYLRGNLGAAYLAWKSSSVIKQFITSPWPTLPYAGPRLFSEAAKCLVNPAKYLRETEELSTFLKNRTADIVLEAVKEAKAGNKAAKLLLKANKAGMKGLELADRFSVAVGWRAVYEKALEETNGDQAKAVEKADDAIMKSQPSARGVDLAPIYRGKSESMKMLLQFTQAMNVIWQNIRYDIPTALRAHQLKTAIGIGVSYAIAGILLNAASQGLDDDDDKSKKMAFWALTQGTESIPLIGQDITRAVRRAVTGEKSPQMSDTALPAIAEIANGMYRLGGGEIEKAAQEFYRGGGMVLGFPVSGVREFGRFVTGDFGAIVGRPDKE